MTGKSALTLQQILASIDTNCINRIMSRIGSIALRAQIGASHLEPRQAVRGYLSDKKVVGEIYRSLSGDAFQIASHVIASGGCFSVASLKSDTNWKKYEAALHECTEKLALFILPEPEHQETACVPIEYMIAGAGSESSVDPLSLLGAFRSYDGNTVREISRVLGLNYRGTICESAADALSYIRESAETLIRSLNSHEAGILDWMFARNGLAYPDEFMERFYPKADGGNYSPYSFDYDFLGTIYHHRVTPPHSILFLKGLLMTFNSYGGWNSAKMIVMPTEICEIFIRDRLGRQGNGRSKPGITGAGHVKLVDTSGDFFINLRKMIVAFLFISHWRKKITVSLLSEVSGCDEYSTSLMSNFLLANPVMNGESGYMDRTEAWYSAFKQPDVLVNTALRFFLGDWQMDAQAVIPDRREFDFLVLNKILSGLANSTGPVPVSSILSILRSDIEINLACRVRCLQIMELQRTEKLMSYETGKTVVTPLVPDIVNRMTFLTLKNLCLAGILASDREALDADSFVGLSGFGRNALSGAVEEGFGDQFREKQSPLIVQPNLEIVADLFISLEDLNFLSSFSEEVSIDRVCRFRVTRKSVIACVNAGTASETIRSFLKSRSSTGVPETLDRMLSDVSGKVGEIELIRCQAVMKVKDKFLAEELVRKKNLSKYLDGRAAENILIVKEGVSLNSLLTSMKKAGYVPRFEE